jgi:ribonuclease HII
MTVLPRGTAIRRDAGLYGYERALERRGLAPVAGVDEAGRGALAGPIVAAAVILDGPIAGLADSKLLTAARRAEVDARIRVQAVAVSVVVIDAAEIDRVGIQPCNIAALRRALAKLAVRPGYVLTDGFAVDGLDVPGLAMWKGDRVAASIAAASVVAKVARDAMMAHMHQQFPAYGFATHKGYATDAHRSALAAHGPCREHRMTWAPIRRVNEEDR